MRKFLLFPIFILALCMIGCDPGVDDEFGEAQLASSDEVDDPAGNSVYGSSYAARLRCLARMALPNSQTYELGHVLSNDMPQSPFAAAPFQMTPAPTQALPFLAHAANGENFSGDIGSQGTQFDGLGHFGYLPGPWIPASGAPDFDSALYYGGLTQADVKPDPAGPLAALGVETVPPIVTSALILDVQSHLGRAMIPGEVVTKAHVLAALPRPILPGDAVFIRTGYGVNWYDDPSYYAQGPGLAKDAVDYLGGKKISVVGLDNPFTDPFQPCQLTGQCGSNNGADPSLPFYSHHAMLAVYGVHQIQNLKLDEIADDGVRVACAMILPLRIRGSSSSPVRPVAFGAPN